MKLVTRPIGLLAGIIVIAIIALPGAARADARADALLQQLAAATRATPSLSAELVLRDQAPDGTRTWVGPIDLQHPNKARVHLTYTVSPSAGSWTWSFLSDGKMMWSWESSTDPRHLRASDKVRTWPADPRGTDIDPMAGAIPIPFFFTQSLEGFFPKTPPPTRCYLGQQTIEGASYDVVELTGGQVNPLTLRLYIGPDRLLHRSQMIQMLDDGQHTYEAALNNMETGKSLAPETFRFSLPEGMTIERVRSHQEQKDALLAVNAPAPSFSLPTPNGGTLTLPQALKGRKALLLNFWFYH
jgi:outer membrane lipoprotein-sorting protein